MPDFATFSGLNLERQLTPEELVRALRFLVSAEYEAVQLYQQIHDAAPDEKIKEGIKSVIDEERVHAGEFLKMISYLDPEEIKFYLEGFKESDDYLKTAGSTNITKDDIIEVEKTLPPHQDLLRALLKNGEEINLTWLKDHWEWDAGNETTAKLIVQYAREKNILTKPYTRFKQADYPAHPDTVVITKNDRITDGPVYQEKDIWSYYEGIKGKLISELKDQDLFIRLKTKSGAVYIRHPFTGKGEYIRINNEKQFEEYHTGRIVEFHTTMPAMCPFYIVDLDAVGDWNKTKKTTADIADGLEKLPEVKKVEIRYTGKRGFHVLGWLKKTKPIDQAREDLKKWLKETFGDREDLVVGESPKGTKSALGVSPMKLNGGQVAKWSLRVTGLCCIEVPRTKLMSFQKEDATIEKTYKKLTGKSFVSTKKMAMAKKIAMNFIESCMTCSNCKESFDWAGMAQGSINCPQCGVAINQEGIIHAS